MPSASSTTFQHTKPLPITTGIAAVLAAILLGLYVGSKFLLRAWLFSSLSLSLIVVAALGFHHIVVSYQDKPSNFPRRRFKPFAFSNPDKWPAAVRSLRAQSAFPKEFRELLVPGAKDLSDQTGGLLRLIMRDFVLEWFEQISDDAAFPIAVEKAVRTALVNLRERVLLTISDPTDILVRKFLPMFTSHLADFTIAERAVRGSRVLTESEEVDKIVATRYGASKPGGLHPATALSFSDPKIPQQEWLRALMERVLPYVMPEKEAKSRTVLVLVREIVACAVLYPVMNILADSDVWNQLIEHMAASAIQDRRKVKKFRAALSKQLDSPSKQNQVKFNNKLKKLVQYNEEETYQSLLQLCRSCEVLSDLRRLRNDLVIIISKVEAYRQRLAAEGKNSKKNIDGLLKRLDDIKSVLDERIVLISGKSIRRRSTLVKPSNAALTDLLLSASGQSYFMEFMDRRGRMRLVQFWLLVNNIKDPLEDADSDPLPQHSSWTENDVDDLSAILNGYYSDPTLDVDTLLKQDLIDFLNDPSAATVEQYQQARKAILITQQSVYQAMERQDWPIFQKTDLWHKYLAAADSAPTTPARPPPPKFEATPMTRSQSAGTIPSKPLGIPAPRNDSATDLRKLLRKTASSRIPSEESHLSSDDAASRGEESPMPNPQMSDEDMVNAISAALNDIIKSDSKDDSVSMHSRTSSEFGERLSLNSERLSIDLPRASTEVLDDRRTLSDPPSQPGQHRERVPIFDDDDDNRPDFTIDSIARSTSHDDTRAGFGIHVDLIEELEMVDVDIERLRREIQLTTRMIGKAELTGSYEELRLLKDSRASMERELSRKEQLRDTYANQDGEHNVTERITIESSAVGHEPGSDFVLYNIIVRQFGPDGVLVSSWTVSRRYSEFYELHRNLRRQFADVKNVPFPKKSNPIGAVLKPTRGGFVEGRMVSLEKYIQMLLLIPGVRESPDVRSFLAPQSLGSNPPDSPALDTSPMESSVESLSNLPVTIVNGSGSPRKATTVPEQAASSDVDTKSLSSKSNDYVELTPITIPIFDMMIELFDLHQGNNWPRKALIDAVQRLLGGTIERIVRSQVSKYLVESYLVDIMKQVQDAVWPNGILKKDRPARSAKEKAKTKRDALFKLGTIFEDAAGNIMGHSNARSGATRLASLCQNSHLNTHFAYTVLDEMIATLFPELGHPREHSLNM